MKFFAAIALVCALVGLPAAGHAAAQPEDAEIKRLTALRDSLHPVTDKVEIPAAHATLNLGKDFYFLPADEAKRVLTEGWGNPAEATSDVLGMVFPTGKTFLDDTWGAVVTYQDSGHVSDDDAASTNYDELLTQMREGEEQRNAERSKAGFPTQHLVGWAQPPSYDPQRKLLIWARNVKFAQETDNTLNYDVRLLARAGVLSLNIVAGMSKLAEVRQAAAGLGAAASFNSGFRYADFNPDIDKDAGYGIAGLIGAGAGLVAAKKLGLLGMILLFGKKFIVVILAALAGLAARFKRLIGKKSES